MVLNLGTPQIFTNRDYNCKYETFPCLNLLAEPSLKCMMKDGLIAACPAGDMLPKELFAKQVLGVGRLNAV